ncbi:EF-1 guanine nucleotide exchange domain [Popillia japonica]|uniref:EF-1 guanine nucleotide exchange domain n=1 Tax=Popillia japonica TaxID=7064 RepID=A0AAW1KSM7_POPJA
MSMSLANENVWTERPRYEEAEQQYYESLNKATLTPLAAEVAKARQRLTEIRDDLLEPVPDLNTSVDSIAIKFLERKVVEFQKVLSNINDKLATFDKRLQTLENSLNKGKLQVSHSIELPASDINKIEDEDEGEDVDLFDTDSEDDAEAERIREERLAAYNEKKSKKPALIAKSSVILDIKPWDDETDMGEMEELIRKIEMDGLLWGASKLVPLAYGIKKLQINCVIEDDKVSMDELQEKIEENENHVQSVDIAAFNKI